jgi:aminoglycoside phosphotransferase (APT) family kinase protein
MNQSPAPLDLDDVLSPEWLSAALAARYPSARVVSATVVETLTTIASKVRFRVEYEDGPAAELPTAFCVKGYFAPESRSRASIGQPEARFYRDLAPMLDVRVPPCVYTGIDPDTGHGLVIMSDLVAAGSVFLTALSPYTPDQAAATLDQLARLNAAGWDGALLRDARWLDPRLTSFTNYVSVERLQDLLDDGRAATVAPAVRRADRLRAGFLALAARAATGPACLIHGDAHAGNLYLTPAGEPGLIDWQMVQRGPWALDVAYHIGAVLAVPDRERCERDLLTHYLDCLRSHGVAAPAWPEAWQEYRRALVYGYLLWAMTQRVEEPITREFVTRLGKAVEAHGSFELLGV